MVRQYEQLKEAHLLLEDPREGARAAIAMRSNEIVRDHETRAGKPCCGRPRRGSGSCRSSRAADLMLSVPGVQCRPRLCSWCGCPSSTDPPRGSRVRSSGPRPSVRRQIGQRKGEKHIARRATPRKALFSAAMIASHAAEPALVANAGRLLAKGKGYRGRSSCPAPRKLLGQINAVLTPRNSLDGGPVMMVSSPSREGRSAARCCLSNSPHSQSAAQASSATDRRGPPRASCAARRAWTQGSHIAPRLEHASGLPRARPPVRWQSHRPHGEGGRGSCHLHRVDSGLAGEPEGDFDGRGVAGQASAGSRATTS